MLIRSSLLNSVSSIALAANTESGTDNQEETNTEAGDGAEDEQSETETVDISAVPKVAQSAYEIADRFSEDAQFTEHVEENLVAKEVAKKGPIVAALDIFRILKVEGIRLLPEAGSKGDETSNKPYDKYTYKQQQKDGTWKTRNGSFYTNLVNRLPAGKQIAAELEAVNARLAKRKDPKDTALKSRWSARFTNLRKNFVTGARVALKMVDIADRMPLVGVSFVWDVEPEYNEQGEETKAGVLMNTPACIMLYPINGKGYAQALTVEAFLSTNIDEALRKGGKHSDLGDTAGNKKAPAAGENETPVPDSMASFMTVANCFVSALSDPKFAVKISTALDKKNSTDADELILTLGEGYLELDAIWKNIKTRYEALRDRNAKAEEAAAQNELNKAKAAG